MKSLTCHLALGLLLASSPLTAQTLIAHYPLMSDLNDATTNNGPFVLYGNPTPPAAPNRGLCFNGIYRYSSTVGGQDAITPAISALDTTDFEVSVEFKLSSLPTSGRAPILMAGNLWRWIGIYVDAQGAAGIKHNNSNYAFSTTTTLQVDRWYVGLIKYEQGTAQLYIDGAQALSASVGTLNFGRADQKNFCTNDYANGSAHHGCIRNLRVYNDTCLSCGTFTRFTGSCAGLRISEGGSPKPGGTVTLQNSGPNASGSGFFFGAAPLQVQLCPQNYCILGLNPLGLLTGPNQSLGIPNSASLIGSNAYFQGVTVTPTGGCSLLALTDTIRVEIGQ